MSSLLLQINFKNKKQLTMILLKSIIIDLIATIKSKQLFEKKEKIYMKYKIN